jgi:hypothetical protein
MIARELKSDLMLYDPEVDDIHILNETARAIYRLCTKGMSFDEIEVALRKEFHFAGDDNLRQDIYECLQALKEKGIIAEAPFSPDKASQVQPKHINELLLRTVYVFRSAQDVDIAHRPKRDIPVIVMPGRHP